MVVTRPEVAEQMLLAGDLPCPRCRGVLRPFGNGRTRTVRGVGADTVTVTQRRARCADCRVTQIPADRADRPPRGQHRGDRERPGRARRRGRAPLHRRSVRPTRIHRPTMVARRPRPARAVAVPAWRRPCRRDRPGAAGPAGAAADHARARVEPARRRRTALPRSVGRRRPGMGVDRLLRPRPAPGTPAPAAKLKSVSRRALPCPAVSVTVPTKVRQRTSGNRQFADQAATSPASVTDFGLHRR